MSRRILLARFGRRRRRTPPPVGLSVTETAQALGLSRTTLYKLWQANDGPPRSRFGRRVIVRLAALVAYLKQREK